MKKLILHAAFASLIFLNACSSETVSTPKNNSNVSPPAPNITLVPVEEINQIPANNQGNLGVTNRFNNKRLTESAPNGQTPPVSNVEGAPAPYNSTIKTLMNKQNQFVEIREFKSDPLLLKVERLQEIKKIKVYLKSGKVIDLAYETGDKLFLAASPDDILIASGAKSAPTPAPDNPNAKKQQ